jgi:hypothetical protein
MPTPQHQPPRHQASALPGIAVTPRATRPITAAIAPIRFVAIIGANIGISSVAFTLWIRWSLIVAGMLLNYVEMTTRYKIANS